MINAATPQGFCSVRIWGVSLQEIAQASNLNKKNIQIFGGMQKGLPLANPAQSGLLFSGTILQAFGNWIGTDQTLDFVVMAGTGSASQPGGVGTIAAPKNIVLNWSAGQQLSAALAPCLKTAFPNYKQKINISPKIVRPNTEVTFYPTLEQLAQYCLETSHNIIQDPTYPGVALYLQNDTLVATDGSAALGTPATQIAFQDMIGQPTWISAPNITTKLVMRADLAVRGQIKLPPSLVTNSAAAATSLVNQNVSFAGGFQIVSLRHVGRYRAPQADGWVTVVEAAPNQVQGTT